ncbi:MAG: nuclear transport factor 2 family protein [Cyanobacteria bacterium P01_G01_bin.38]
MKFSVLTHSIAFSLLGSVLVLAQPLAAEVSIAGASTERDEVIVADANSSESLLSTTEIRQLTARWFEAWSPGARPIDWDAMGALFSQTPGTLLIFDDAGGTVVVLESWADYRATWEPFMEQFPEWQIEPEGEIRVLLEGDLATTMFTLVGGGVDREGNTVEFRQRATHVWQRIDNQWVIVHEHLTTDS